MAVLRLKDVIKEFNISSTRVVETLAEHGITIQANPNARVEQIAYDILVDQFQADKKTKRSIFRSGN